MSPCRTALHMTVPDTTTEWRSRRWGAGDTSSKFSLIRLLSAPSTIRPWGDGHIQRLEGKNQAFTFEQRTPPFSRVEIADIIARHSGATRNQFEPTPMIGVALLMFAPALYAALGLVRLTLAAVRTVRR